MPTIDERVVAMAFENAKFEAAIAQTMKTLDKLNQSLAQVGATSGFDKIEAQANKVNLQGPMSAIDKLKQKLGMGVNAKAITDIEGAGNKVTLNGPQTALDKVKQKLGSIGGGKELSDIQGASDRVTLDGMTESVGRAKQQFDALRFAAIVAFGTIVHKVTNASLALTKKLTVQPLIDGFHEYETQINAVQTIQANTGLTGKKGLEQINAALTDLNHYADKTIYNFSEMAKNIGTFTAAGVDLKTATGSIKGIANLAAASGSNSQQASTAMYQLSQAISAGRVSLQDWNSVVNAGMGGTMFQKALVNTAEAMGTLDKSSVHMGKHIKISGESFREAISAKPGQKSWLTGDVLTATLKNFTGDMTNAQLAAEGFNKEQIKTIQMQAKTAVEAATKIKTFSQMMSALKEAVSSAWGSVFKTLFGDIGQAKQLFTPLYNILAKLLAGPVQGFNKALQVWAKMGGRTMFFKAMQTAFTALGKILGTVHDAFRDVFPASTGKSLLELTKHFVNFANALKPSPALIANLRATFRGLFAILDIGWQIVKKVVGVIFDLLGVAKTGAGGFLAFTGGIGNFLVAIDNAIKKGHALDGFFNGLTAVLRVPLHILSLITGAFFGLFGGIDGKKADDAANSIQGVSDSLKPLSHVVDNAKKAWQDLINFFGKLREKFGPAIHKALEPVIHIGDTIMNAFKNIDATKATQILQTGLLAGIFVAFRKMVGGGVSFTLTKLDGVNSVLGQLTGNLKTMQRNVQAKTLFQIATSIALLAAGIGVLSLIDPAALTKAMTAVAVGLGQLVGTMFLLSKATSGAGIATMPLLAASMVALATAVTILAAAVKIFSTMSWDELIRGLVGVGGALAAIGIGMKGIGGVRMTVMAPGLIAVALAMNLLAVAMKQFGSLSWDEITKGLIGMGGALLTVGFALQSFGPQTLLIAPGLVIVAIAMAMLAGAVGAFGSLNWDTLGKGLAGMTAALLLLGAALWEMPPGPLLAAQAAGLVILSVALSGIAAALKVMGGMSVAGIAKGLVTLGGALFILAVGLDLMAGTIPGALALMAAAAGLALLAPTLAFMGTLKWGTIFKGLAAIAASLLVLAAVGAVASTGLLTLGVALAALAAAVLIAGTGMFLLGKGLSSIGDAGARSVAVMIAAMTAFVLALPGLIISFVKGLVEAVAELAKILPSVADSLAKVLGTVVDVIIKIMPKIQQALESVLTAFINVVNNKSGDLIAAGWKLLLNFLTGISNNIGQVTTKVAEIIVKFLNALTNRMPALIHAGARLIIAFLRGITNAIPGIVDAVGTLIATFLVALGNQLHKIITAGTTMIVRVLKGIADAMPRIRRAAIHLIRVFFRNLVQATIDLAYIVVNGLIAWAESMAHLIREKDDDFRKAGKHLAGAVMAGFTFGLSDKVSDALGGLKDFVSKPNNKNAGKGLGANAIDPRAGRGAGRTVSFKKRKKSGKVVSFKKTDAADLSGIDPNPTITPVVDLTNVDAAGKKINGTLAVNPKVSVAHAAAASRATDATRARTEEHKHQRPVLQHVTFKQTNTSPKALSEQDIYRRTKSQLAQAKKKLGLHGDVAVIGT